jgi:hypothetical protein
LSLATPNHKSPSTFRAVPTVDLSAKSKTTTSAKMNTRNHLLQWYEVQDNKCSEIISYNGRRGRSGARLQPSLPNGDFARSCGLDSREEVKYKGRNQILCFPSLSSLTMLPCHQFADVSSHLLGWTSSYVDH